MWVKSGVGCEFALVVWVMQVLCRARVVHQARVSEEMARERMVRAVLAGPQLRSHRHVACFEGGEQNGADFACHCGEQTCKNLPPAARHYNMGR